VSPRGIVGAAVVGVVAGGLAGATTPGARGRIVFQRYRFHDVPVQADLAVTGAGGGAVREAIVFATTAAAMQTARSDLPDVFTMNLDGTGIHAATRERNWDGAPDWGQR
jgi:hypothetical protein